MPKKNKKIFGVIEYIYEYMLELVECKEGMVPISKCVTNDSGYHVNGALVVAPERAIQNSIEQLKRIVA